MKQPGPVKAKATNAAVNRAAGYARTERAAWVAGLVRTLSHPCAR